MSRVEDALRDVMRAHDADAPTAAGFRFRRPVAAPRQRFRWVPAVAAAACAAIVVAVVLALGPGDPGRDRAAAPTAAPVLDCPATVAAPSHTDYWLPPPRPDALDVSDRLVPTAAPVHAVVCAYLHPDAGRLTGSRVVDRGLAVLAGTLAWLPPGDATAQACPAEAGGAGLDYYLIGLSYPTGTMWVAAPGDCVGSSNGRFKTRVHVASDAIAAYRTGGWTQPAEPLMNGCPVSPGRLGQEHAMVPGAPVSVLVCATSGGRFAPHSPVSESRTGSAADLKALVTALNALPTQPDSFAFKCGITRAPEPSYRIVFTYSVGLPAEVIFARECAPAIHNGSLQASFDARVAALITKILGR